MLFFRFGNGLITLLKQMYLCDSDKVVHYPKVAMSRKLKKKHFLEDLNYISTNRNQHFLNIWRKTILSVTAMCVGA